MAQIQKDFNTYFRENTAVMLLIDAETAKIEDANKAALAFYGYSYAEICSMHLWDINVLSEQEVRMQVKLVSNRIIDNVVYQHKLKDGSIRYVNAFTSAVDEEGRKLNLSINHDITHQVEDQKEIKRLFEVLDNSISFVAIADADRKIIYSNKLMQELLGITPGDSALTKYNHKGSSTLDISAEANRQLQETGIWKGEATLKGKAGTVLPVIQSIYAHKNEKGIIEYYSVTSIEKTTPL